jgi:hypothetical protein
LVSFEDMCNVRDYKFGVLSYDGEKNEVCSDSVCRLSQSNNNNNNNNNRVKCTANVALRASTIVFSNLSATRSISQRKQTNKQTTPTTTTTTTYNLHLIISRSYDGFKGGLQTSGHTGSHSIVATIEECRVMYHVATMLPYSTTDTQQ